jgi:hypothetical protein
MQQQLRSPQANQMLNVDSAEKVDFSWKLNHQISLDKNQNASYSNWRARCKNNFYDFGVFQQNQMYRYDPNGFHLEAGITLSFYRY